MELQVVVCGFCDGRGLFIQQDNIFIGSLVSSILTILPIQSFSCYLATIIFSMGSTFIIDRMSEFLIWLSYTLYVLICIYILFDNSYY